jgi:hypothetical protein
MFRKMSFDRSLSSAMWLTAGRPFFGARVSLMEDALVLVSKTAIASRGCERLGSA